MSKVEVYFKDKLAGALEKTVDGRFIFEYEDSYVYSADSQSIAFTLPKDKKRFESTDLFAFFDGLIPEGWLLNLASKELRLNPLSDRFELLVQLCHNTIGAIHIGHKKESDESFLSSVEYKKDNRAHEIKKFRKCLICYEDSDDVYHEHCMINIFGQKIEPIVDINEEFLEELAKKQINQKLALSGFQRKLSLDLNNESKNSRLTVTDLWGRYIFKPRGAAPHFPENEHLCLKLAESFKIQAEASALIPTTSGKLAFIAKRFDRAESRSHLGGAYKEFHQEDFCQILDKPTYKKYNASLEQVGKILRKYSDFQGDNLYRLYELTLFNFIIGNVDAHLKNITLIYENSRGKRKVLSPAYDLLSTDLYIKNDNEESALAINGKKNKLTENDFLMLAKSFGLSEKVHQTLIKRFINHLPVWESIIDKSFLPPKKREEFKELIKRKLSRFSSGV